MMSTEEEQRASQAEFERQRAALEDHDGNPLPPQMHRGQPLHETAARWVAGLQPRDIEWPNRTADDLMAELAPLLRPFLPGGGPPTALRTRAQAMEDLEHVAALALALMESDPELTEEFGDDWRAQAIEHFRLDLQALGVTEEELNRAGITTGATMKPERTSWMSDTTPWGGKIGMEGTPTADGRRIDPGALRLPVPARVHTLHKTDTTLSRGVGQLTAINRLDGDIRAGGWVDTALLPPGQQTYRCGFEVDIYRDRIEGQGADEVYVIEDAEITGLVLYLDESAKPAWPDCEITIEGAPADTAADQGKPAWCLRVTYADFEADEFLELGGAGWDTQAERDEQFAGIPAAPDPSGDPAAAGSYVLDVLDPDGSHVDDKTISAETALALLGEPLELLMEQARQRNRDAIETHQAQRSQQAGAGGDDGES